ncbi:hypothetical protein ACKLNQ_18505 [Myroides odoratimimus]|uniref:hypothetical protein n=1 Tax=Myroides odoratimimus TaxID=76832 RepID=UPI0038D39FBA
MVQLKAIALALVSILVIVSPLAFLKVYTPSNTSTFVVLASMTTTSPATVVCV